MTNHHAGECKDSELPVPRISKIDYQLAHSPPSIERLQQILNNIMNLLRALWRVDLVDMEKLGIFPTTRR